jgi:CubicO group peptidase (beta-lactamase class C family)
MPGTETGQEIIWMAGQTGGVASYIGFDSKSQTGIVILSNQARPARPLTALGIQALQILNEEVDETTVNTPEGVR